VIRSHINDLKQQHIQEMLSCKSQFETDIRNVIERTQWQQGVGEPMQDFQQQSYESEPGE
jgi:hypothetical protein